MMLYKKALFCVHQCNLRHEMVLLTNSVLECLQGKLSLKKNSNCMHFIFGYIYNNDFHRVKKGYNKQINNKQ